MIFYLFLAVWLFGAFGLVPVRALRDGVPSFRPRRIPRSDISTNSSTPSLVSANASISRDNLSTPITTAPAPKHTDPIFACDDDWSSWYSSSLWTSTVTSWTSHVTTLTSTHTVYESTWTCSSTCGNVCYANATTTASSELLYVTTTGFTDYWWQPFTKPTPTCKLPFSACTSIHTVWSSSVADYIKWEGGWWFATPPPWPTSTPGCRWCQNCYITASGELQLFFFPETKNVTRDMCTDMPNRGPLLTSGADPGGPYTQPKYTEVTTGPSVVLSGRTFYSGNVYLSIPYAGASDSCTTQRGSTYSNIMLTMASTDLYSGRASPYGQFPINYADFNTPPPWSAYKAILPCGSGLNFSPGPECTQSTVFPQLFSPIINIPWEIQHIDPQWAGCRPIEALIDPPIALTTMAPLFPTTTQQSNPITTPAQPVPTPDHLQPPTSTPGLSESGKAGDSPNGPAQSLVSSPQNTVSRTTPPLPIITVGTSKYPLILVADSHSLGVIVDPGITIEKGGAAATYGDTTVSIGSSSIMIADPAGIKFVPVPTNRPNGRPGEANQEGTKVTIGGTSFTMDAQGDLVNVGETITIGSRPGSTITVGGEIFTVDSQGNLVQSGRTVTLNGLQLTMSTGEQHPGAIVPLIGETFKVNSGGNLAQSETTVALHSSQSIGTNIVSTGEVSGNGGGSKDLKLSGGSRKYVRCSLWQHTSLLFLAQAWLVNLSLY